MVTVTNTIALNTKNLVTAVSLACLSLCLPSCNSPRPVHEDTSANQSVIDAELAEFISNIKAVDNHAHPNTIIPNDKGYDALPLDGLGAIEVPARVRPESPDWLPAYKAVYGFTGTVLDEKAMKDMTITFANLMKAKGEQFPEWVLDQSGIEVMLANRITMGPGISAPRFRWVSYVDALLFPLSTKSEGEVTPDREKLFPLTDQLLKDYLADLKLSKLPATFDEYLKHVVTGILETQKKGGCVALKFEAAYLRSLHFDKASAKSASEVYSGYLNGGYPSHEKYKLLQDAIFHYIALEAGRLGMAIHIHSFSGFGNYYVAADSDPLLLEPAFNDPELRHTRFVLVHGGGTFYHHTSAMLWKPNVYADISLMTRVWSTDQVAEVLKEWLSQFPEKVLFGTDAASFGPGLGWELNAWIGADTGRRALALALSGMIKSGEVSRERAKEIALMVMRTNAGNLYQLGLK